MDERREGLLREGDRDDCLGGESNDDLSAEGEEEKR